MGTEEPLAAAAAVRWDDLVLRGAATIGDPKDGARWREDEAGVTRAPQGPAGRLRMAMAAAIMPETKSGTPKPL
jgi:hypothetical protein